MRLRQVAFSGLALCSMICAGSAQTLRGGFEKRGGVFLGAPPAPSNPAFHVVSYRLELSLAMVNENFAGRNQITLVMKTPADSVVLYQLKLQVDSIGVDGVQRPFDVSDGAERFTVHLGAVRPAGDTVRLLISYRRIPGPGRLTDRLGYYYFNDTIPGLPANLGYTMSESSNARCWMPCYDEPWEKSTSEMYIAVPQGYVAASNGKLLGTAVNGDGTATWHWREDHQIATYLMCATVSKFVNPSSMLTISPGDTIPVEYFVWPRDSAAAAAFLPVVRQMITNLGALYGPYPWDKYGMSAVTPFAYGGMEHQTITTLHEAYATNEDVVVHELTHQWWGDLVTCGTWKDIWLNESFATYGEALWRESLGGPDSLRSWLDRVRNFRLGSWTGAVYDPEGQGLYLFSDLVYSKGAWVLHTLRGVIGDSSYFRTLRLWRQLYGQKSAVTADFEAAAEAVTGTSLRWFFDEWIYGPGWPKYSVAYDWKYGDLGVRIVQQQDAGWPTYTMPLRVRLRAAGRDTTLTVRDSLRLQDFHFTFPARPDTVILDPDHWALWDTAGSVNPPPVSGTPLEFTLGQNYPNPFNGSSTIAFVVPGVFSFSAPANVKLVVYDILGRRVATLVDGVLLPGEYTVRFDGTGKASGVYFYRLDVQPGGGSLVRGVRKMVLVR